MIIEGRIVGVTFSNFRAIEYTFQPERISSDQCGDDSDGISRFLLERDKNNTKKFPRLYFHSPFDGNSCSDQKLHDAFQIGYFLMESKELVKIHSTSSLTEMMDSRSSGTIDSLCVGIGIETSDLSTK